MITIPVKILMCSSLMFAVGILLTAFCAALDVRQGEDLSPLVALFIAVGVFVSPIFMVGSLIWIICTL